MCFLPVPSGMIGVVPVRRAGGRPLGATPTRCRALDTIPSNIGVEIRLLKQLVPAGLLTIMMTVKCGLSTGLKLVNSEWQEPLVQFPAFMEAPCVALDPLVMRHVGIRVWNMLCGVLTIRANTFRTAPVMPLGSIRAARGGPLAPTNASGVR